MTAPARPRVLSPEQRRQLAARLGRPAQPDPDAPILRRNTKGPSVLSFGQESLWFIEQLMPGTATYNVPNALRMTGPLKVDALRRAIEEIVRRHEVLRTTFNLVDGRPMQAVADSWPSPMTVIDLDGLPESDREIEAATIVRRESSRPFDVARDLMLRVFVIRIAADDHIFLSVSHHIAWDPGSRAIFHDELAALYESFEGGEAAVGDLPIQYADFAAWQRGLLAGATLDRLTSYWGRQLAGAPAHLDLATDHPRPRVSTLKGRKHLFALPERVVEETHRFSIRAKVTLYITWLSAFYGFLCGLSRQDDIVVGSPSAGRTRPEIEKLIGFFITTLALRTRIDRAMTFEQVVARVRTTALDAYAHQDMPFEKLVEVARPPRDRSRNPIFQANFRVAQTPPRSLALAGLSVEPLDLVDTETSKFDIALELAATPGAKGYFEYSTDLFAEETIERMRADFVALLRELLENPGVPLAALPAFQVLEGRRPLDGFRARSMRRATASRPGSAAER